MKIYISFGQVHTHRINGKTFDCDCLAEIDCEDHSEGRKKAFDFFGDEFFTSYSELDAQKSLHYYPRGIIRVS